MQFLATYSQVNHWLSLSFSRFPDLVLLDAHLVKNLVHSSRLKGPYSKPYSIGVERSGICRMQYASLEKTQWPSRSRSRSNIINRCRRWRSRSNIRSQEIWCIYVEHTPWKKYGASMLKPWRVKTLESYRINKSVSGHTDANDANTPAARRAEE